MKREIKFRGKRLKNDIWVYGLLTNDMKGHYRINFDPKSFSCVVKENTIGQFTGLRDKNGNEIYQHDIIQLQGKEIYESLIYGRIVHQYELYRIADLYDVV